MLIVRQRQTERRTAMDNLLELMDNYIKKEKIDLLEKVKEELIYATDVDYDEKTMRFFIGAEDIDRIFGKYIDELKGE